MGQAGELMERHSIRVPLDWLAAASAQGRALGSGDELPRTSAPRPPQELELAAHRWPCANPQTDPIFFLVGGPGEHPRPYLDHPPFQKALAQFAQVADLWLIDQRGTGDSAGPLAGGIDLTPPPEAFAADLWNPTREAVTHEIATRELDPAHWNALQSAHDLVAWANHIGTDRVNLLALSYGTHLSQHLMTLAPGRVGRAVFGGFEGLDQTFKLPANTDEVLARHGAEFVTLVRAVLDADVPELSREARQIWIASMVGMSNRFKHLARILAGLAGGSLIGLERDLAGFKKLWQRPLAFYLFDSASGASVDRWREIEDQAPNSLLSWGPNFPFRGPESGWPTSTLGLSPTPIPHPILVFTGDWDAFTPDLNVPRDWPRLVHRQLEGAFHNDFLAREEFVRAGVEFFVTQMGA